MDNWLGNIIRTYRKDQKMTVRTLAELLGVSSSAVSDWENGKKQPNIESIEKLSKHLNIPIREFEDRQYEERYKNPYDFRVFSDEKFENIKYVNLDWLLGSGIDVKYKGKSIDRYEITKMMALLDIVLLDKLPDDIRYY
jgi:transcriptional regulator with XRE-family HTH domain